jgi:ubiquinone/menaquinone biosynthesis C-methylase UbiE
LPHNATWRQPLASVRRVALRAKWALEDRRLISEQRRGVLGPAHLGWRGNSAAENRLRWDEWDWSSRGEQWNESPEWKQSVIDELIDVWMPRGGVILEIGPGGGRWSEPLLERASGLILVDVSARPLDLCRERFEGAANVGYVLSSGSDIPGVDDGSVDAVWSFDVLVHVAPLDQFGYLSESARILAPGGVAVLHHADGRNRGALPSRAGWRSPMSRDLFAAAARERGLSVERQFDSWGTERARFDLSAFGDAISVLRKPVGG